jgi:3-oxoacyl-[acyl-carrier-protein] synthase-1
MLAAEQAYRDLSTRTLDQCIVGGVDSFLDGSTLQALHEQRRLKSEDAPDGFQPGEAAAFFLLERMDSAVQRGADILAVVTQVALARDEPENGRRIPGVALGNALSVLLGPSSQGPRRGWFISDINGEPGRAMEWGNLLVRLSSSHPWLREAPLWYPASSLGDTGAASGVIGVCAAVRAFARDYAPADVAFVLSSSDGVERGALRVERFTPQ